MDACGKSLPCTRLVWRAIRILCAGIGGARKGKGDGEKHVWCKRMVFVRRRNAITFIRGIIPRESHMKLHNRE